MLLRCSPPNLTEWTYLLEVTRRLDRCTLAPLQLPCCLPIAVAVLPYTECCSVGTHAQEHHELVAKLVCRARDKKALQLAASTLLKHGEADSAKEVLLKLEDWPALIKLHTDAGNWSHAFMTAKRCPAEEPALHEAHAEWLISQDRCGTARACAQHTVVKSYRRQCT